METSAVSCFLCYTTEECRRINHVWFRMHVVIIPMAK